MAAAKHTVAGQGQIATYRGLQTALSMPHLDVLVLLVPALQGGVHIVLHLHVQLLQASVQGVNRAPLGRGHRLELLPPSNLLPFESAEACRSPAQTHTTINGSYQLA